MATKHHKHLWAQEVVCQNQDINSILRDNLGYDRSIRTWVRLWIISRLDALMTSLLPELILLRRSDKYFPAYLASTEAIISCIVFQTLGYNTKGTEREPWGNSVLTCQLRSPRVIWREFRCIFDIYCTDGIRNIVSCEKYGIICWFSRWTSARPDKGLIWHEMLLGIFTSMAPTFDVTVLIWPFQNALRPAAAFRLQGNEASTAVSRIAAVVGASMA